MSWSRHVGDGDRRYAAGKDSCAVLQPIPPRLTSRDCADTSHPPRIRYVASVKPRFALADSTAAREPRLFEQIIVTTAQRLLQPLNRCGQNIQLAGFNFLDSARGKVCQFRQLLLCEPGRTPLPTKILTDGF
jgi:hypothetical protein